MDKHPTENGIIIPGAAWRLIKFVIGQIDPQAAERIQSGNDLAAWLEKWVLKIKTQEEKHD